MLTAEHPTREEWHDRQAGLPDAARATLREIAATRAAEAEVDRKRREGDAAQDATHRADFEAALAEVLAANGADWLAAYRIPDSLRGAQEFDRHTLAFYAGFDPAAVGVWSILIRLDYTRGRGWEAVPSMRPFTALRPDAARSFPNYAGALEMAAQHAPTPF